MPSGKKYTILEFVENFANKNSTYIIKLYDHLTCVKNGVLFDTWNCGNRKIFTIWEIQRLGKNWQKLVKNGKNE